MEATGYNSMSLDELLTAESEYFLRNGRLCEMDLSINDISKGKIMAFDREKGNCLLGNFQIPRLENKAPVARFTQYSGQDIHNFEYDFIIPVDDPTLFALLVEWNKDPQFEHPCVRVGLLNKIFDRIIALNGIILSWA